MEVVFGQGKRKKRGGCQNGGRIRIRQAQKERKLSEWGSHSDKARGEREEAVRIEVAF
jgi:hypothetical protein